jgi:hypothetical protein
MPSPDQQPYGGEIPDHLLDTVQQLGEHTIRAAGSEGGYSGTAAEAAAQCPFAQQLDAAGFVTFVAEHLEQ